MATSPKTSTISNPTTTQPTTQSFMSHSTDVQQQQQHQQDNSSIQPFPPPQTFTFLPQLYTLISRLTPLQAQSATQPQLQSTNGIPVPSTAANTTSRQSRSPTLTRRTAGPTSSGDTGGNPDGASLSLTQTRSRDETIEIKDLPGLVYPLRLQVERAKEVVRAMPDVGRSIELQEREVRELEGRIGALKERLGVLGSLAAKGRDGDVVMRGVEG